VTVGTTAGEKFIAGTIYYAEPANAHQLYLHLSADSALLGTPAGRIVADVTSANNAIYPNSFSGQPMVPLTEALYFKNRLIGLNGRNNVAVSDPGDLLHLTPFTGALTAALGNGDPLTTILALGDNTSGGGGNSLILASATQVLGIVGLSGGSDNWELVQVTDQFGSIAPLAAVQVGKDGWLLSRSGVMLVEQTAYGRLQANPVPMSRDILRKFAEIDWTNAGQSCAAYFNNRYLLAVPLKNQEGTVVNNCLFIYNQLTQAWDHFWTGACLNPVQFAKLTIGGEERLAFLNANGDVMYFDPDGHADITCDSADGGNSWTYTPTDIVLRAWLRGYTNGTPRIKQFQMCELVVDTLNANWSLTAIREDVNNTKVYRENIAGDPLKFVTHAEPDYAGVSEPDRAQLPGREDYSVTVDAAGDMDLNVLGKVFEAHQSWPDRIPLEERSRSLQFLFENTRGSARLRSVYVEAVPEID